MTFPSLSNPFKSLSNPFARRTGNAADCQKMGVPAPTVTKPVKAAKAVKAAKPVKSAKTGKHTSTPSLSTWFSKHLKPSQSQATTQAQQHVSAAVTQQPPALLDNAAYLTALQTLKQSGDTNVPLHQRPVAQLAFEHELPKGAAEYKAQLQVALAPSLANYAEALQTPSAQPELQTAQLNDPITAGSSANDYATALLASATPPAVYVAETPRYAGPDAWDVARAAKIATVKSTLKELRDDMLLKGQFTRELQLDDGRTIKAFFTADKQNPNIKTFVIEDKEGIDTRGSAGDSVALRDDSLRLNRLAPDQHENLNSALNAALDNAERLLAAQGAPAVTAPATGGGA